MGRSYRPQDDILTGRVLYGGRWLTPEQIARKREINARYESSPHGKLRRQLQDMTRTRIRL